MKRKPNSPRPVKYVMVIVVSFWYLAADFNGPWNQASPAGSSTVWAQPIDEEVEEPAGAAPRPAGAAPDAQPMPTRLDESAETDLETLDPGAEEPLGGQANLLDLLDQREPGSVPADPAAGDEVYDIIVERIGGRSTKTFERKVALMNQWYELPLQRNASYVFERYAEINPPESKLVLQGDQVEDIRYYELRMFDRAASTVLVTPRDDMLSLQGLLSNPGPANPERAAKAKAILRQALAEHDSALQRNRRTDRRFEQNIRAPLATALFNLKMVETYGLIRRRDFPRAEALCEQIEGTLARRDPNRRLLIEAYERMYLDVGRQALARNDEPEARRQLLKLLERAPDHHSKEFDAFRNEIIERAKSYVVQADGVTDQRRKIELLEKAQELWPELQGLARKQRDLEGHYEILQCAFASLPRQFCPLTLRTAEDRYAAELMFESLVRWSRDPRIGSHYDVELAEGLPIPLARGRGFHLPRCVWSDSDERQRYLCTAEDVSHTLKLLREFHPPGYSPAWEDLVLKVDTAENHPYSLAVQLKRDHWQPLALMDFMIVPHHRFPMTTDAQRRAEQIERFNEQPSGTGPYCLQAVEPDRVRFVANPHYRDSQRPHIEEISFRALDPDAARAAVLQGDNVQMIYGVRRDHVVQLRQQDFPVVRLHTPTVYFLAPNYRRPNQLKNENLRLAIAHAIDRNLILKQYFLPPGDSLDRGVLRGIYPLDSWARNPKIPAFSREKAASYLNEAEVQLNTPPRRVRMIYPDRNVDVERACKEIQKQLDEIEIKILLQPIAPESYYDEVVEVGNFDLAYWHYAYLDETYRVNPLFDPNDPVTNIMGYNPTPTLSDLFSNMALHKRFRKLQALAHEVDAYIARTVPVIPLWQLDTYVAIHPKLNIERLDPIHPFRDAKDWKFEPSRAAGR